MPSRRMSRHGWMVRSCPRGSASRRNRWEVSTARFHPPLLLPTHTNKPARTTLRACRVRTRLCSPSSRPSPFERRNSRLGGRSTPPQPLPRRPGVGERQVRYGEDDVVDRRHGHARLPRLLDVCKDADVGPGGRGSVLCEEKTASST